MVLLIWNSLSFFRYQENWFIPHFVFLVYMYELNLIHACIPCAVCVVNSSRGCLFHGAVYSFDGFPCRRPLGIRIRVCCNIPCFAAWGGGGGPQMRPQNRGPMPHKDGAIKTSPCPEASSLTFAAPRQMISVRQNLVIFP